MIRFFIAFIFFFLLKSVPVFSQEARIYFEKIVKISIQNKNSNSLFEQLDSLERTRIPSRSFINKIFDRDVDFNIKHQRINLQLNFINYQIDLLTKNDSAFFVSVFSRQTNDYKSKTKVALDSIETLNYLSKRNTFYKSKKTIDDLISDLKTAETYAFYCGEANSKTEDGKKIESLVDRKNIYTLNNKLKSFCCETQAYGVAGFKMLIRKRIKISEDDLKLVNFLENRNSELVTCSGCFFGIVTKVYKQND